VIVGVPLSVHSAPDVLVTVIAPTRDPAAPSSAIVARSADALHPTGPDGVELGVLVDDAAGGTGCGAPVPRSACTPANAPTAIAAAASPVPTAFIAIRRRARRATVAGITTCDGMSFARRRSASRISSSMSLIVRHP